ncbi:unnamed protein product [Urochloa humidicola]
MVRGESQARRAMPMYHEAVKDGRRAWTEGPEETMRDHGRFTWCTEEQKHMEAGLSGLGLKTTSGRAAAHWREDGYEFSGLGLKTGGASGGRTEYSEDAWRHREACVETKQSREGAGSVR